MTRSNATNFIMTEVEWGDSFPPLPRAVSVRLQLPFNHAGRIGIARKELSSRFIFLEGIRRHATEATMERARFRAEMILHCGECGLHMLHMKQ